MKRPKVVITDCDQGSIEEEKAVFSEFGADLDLAQMVNEEEIVARCYDADGLIIQYAPITRGVLERLARCKVISRYGVGVDTIDLQAATEFGVIVANVLDYCVDEVSDQTLALFLCLVRKVILLDRSIRSGTWDFRVAIPIHRLNGMTYGIVGCGKIGQGIARRVSVFGLRVIGYDPYLTEAPGIQMVPLERLLAESDFISIHCSLTESSHHLFRRDQFRMMGRKPLVMNLARGAVVDEAALIEALEKGWIGGAGLDVLETEPPDSESPLMRREDVILTPHIGFYSEESKSELKRRTAENVTSVFMGKLPDSVVNKEVVGRSRAGL
ncbi:MAG: C-terminal binding protein [Syntrophobacterales bacterium]|nr:MAG: C-terminal binding protein [Syntrophobacterales bacterium]